MKTTGIKFDYKYVSFNIINFADLLNDISVNVLNDLYNLNISSEELKNKNISEYSTILKFRLYNILSKFFLVKNNLFKEIPIIFISNILKCKCELYNFFNKKEINDEIISFIKRISKYIPVIIYFGDQSYNNIKKLINGNSGEIQNFKDKIFEEYNAIISEKKSLNSLNKIVFGNNLKIKNLVLK